MKNGPSKIGVNFKFDGGRVLIEDTIADFERIVFMANVVFVFSEMHRT